MREADKTDERLQEELFLQVANEDAIDVFNTFQADDNADKEKLKFSLCLKYIGYWCKAITQTCETGVLWELLINSLMSGAKMEWEPALLQRDLILENAGQIKGLQINLKI